MDNSAQEILNYLEDHVSSYPFHAETDSAFVAELINDFQDLDILEETKAFRWYYESEPAAKLKNPRLGLRRWLAKANAWRKVHPPDSARRTPQPPQGHAV